VNEESAERLYASDRIVVDKIVTEPLDNNVFLLTCAASNKSVIIDASAEAARVLKLAADTDVRAILTTHGHWDHVGAAAEVAAALAIPVYIGEEDAALSGLEGTHPLTAGAIALGELELEIVATPGHTPGSRCISVGPVVFTGDTLFPGGPGATQDQAAFTQIMESLDTRLFTRPDDTMILPGHGLHTTIGTERGSVEDWRERGW
jgi:glyoxylase-like metal-dependent hydrolase (beta-lactamase superfamily II)